MEHNFDGLKVLDFSRVLVGPWLTQVMRDMGAEVIKIERPFTGTDERGFTPFGEGIHGTQSGYYMMVNRGKKSIVLDLKDPDCKQAIFALIKWADVLVENFAPGVMKKLGYDYPEARKVNPGLIYLSVSVFGQEGPLAGLPGYDISAQAMSGLMWMCGETDGPPMRDGTSIGDVNCSGYALGAIGAALYYRHRTGKGQYIDMSLRDCLTSELETALVRYTVSKGADDPIRSGRHHATLAPYGIFEGREGRYCVIVGLTPATWTALCHLMGEEDWGAQEKFQTAAERGKHVPEIVAHIEAWLKTFNDHRDAIALMQQARIPAVPVLRISEVVQDPQWRMRQNLVHVEDPIFGGVDLPATPMIFSETSVYNDTPAPLLGQHTSQVLREVAHLPEAQVAAILSKFGGT